MRKPSPIQPNSNPHRSDEVSNGGLNSRSRRTCRTLRLADRLFKRVVECPRASGAQVGMLVVKHTRDEKVIRKAKGSRRLQRTQVIEEAVLKLVDRAQPLG